MNVLLVIAASYVSAGLAMVVLFFAYRAAEAQPYLISDNAHRSKTDAELYKLAALNTVFSVGLIFAILYGFTDWLVYEESAPLWRHVVEAGTVILIYDFGYYFMHRYPFHEWEILRSVHAVHHAARNPRVIDSMLMHPVEAAMGLSLFFGTVALVGGVQIVTLGVLFSAYTAFNVLNHAGVDVPKFPFKTLGLLARKHDRHHHSMRSGNYASITPLPDLIFGTVE